jgi:hypothetical protein
MRRAVGTGINHICNRDAEVASEEHPVAKGDEIRLPLAERDQLAIEHAADRKAFELGKQRGMFQRRRLKTRSPLTRTTNRVWTSWPATSSTSSCPTSSRRSARNG